MDSRHCVEISTKCGEVQVIKPVLRRKDNASASPSYTPIEFAQKIKDISKNLDVTMVQIENWVILQRSKFDLTVNDEPYSALQLYINLKTRTFITRVWGKTHAKGEIKNAEEMEETCQQTFAKLTCPGFKDGGNQENLLCVEYPFKRMVSPECDVLHKRFVGQSSVTELCSHCNKSCKTKEDSDPNEIDEDNVDSDILEVEVERKVHEVITVDDDPMNFKEDECKDLLSDQLDVQIDEPYDYNSVEEPAEHEALEEPLEDDIFDNSDGSKNCSKANIDPGAAFVKSTRKLSKQINYATLLGRKDKPASKTEKEKPRLPRQNQVSIFSHIVRYPKGWTYGSVKCEHCGQILKGAHKSAFRRHYVRFHNFGNFFCSLCKFFAFYPHQHASHLLQEHPDMEGGVSAKCPMCYSDILVTKSSDSDSFTEHYKECANNKIRQRGKFHRESENNQVVCDTCGKSILRTSLTLHMQTHTDRETFECSYPGCNKKLLGRQNFKIHLRIAHTEEQRERFHCEYCGKNIFKTESDLKVHIRFVHEKQSQDIKCTECELVFARRYQMVIHKNLVHFPDKHRCSTCLKSFGNNDQLKKHSRSHQDIKSYECDVCGKRLASSSSLIEHKRLHTGEKPYPCNYCPYRGLSSCLLCHHKRQVHKAEYEEEKKEKERNKIKVSSNPSFE